MSEVRWAFDRLKNYLEFGWDEDEHILEILEELAHTVREKEGRRCLWCDCRLTPQWTETCSKSCAGYVRQKGTGKRYVKRRQTAGTPIAPWSFDQQE